MTRCLLVDDDAEIRTLVAGYLARHGLQVDTVPDGASLKRRLPDPGLEVLVLDLMLPDSNGLDLCRWARQVQPALAILMLTAQGDPLSRVLGLELGADDYLPKPFEPRELAARIHATLRRGRQVATAAPVSVRFAGWTFDRVRRQLTRADGTLVALSAAEFRLLDAFVEHAGRALARERLIALTQAPGTAPNERAIDLAVSRLRAKLGDAAPIRTVRGEGYRFDAEIQR